MAPKAITALLLGVSLLVSGMTLGCATDPYGRPIVTQNQAIGSVAGGLAGAAIGNKVGSRSRETGNTVLGGVAGALLGGWLGGQLDRDRHYDRRPYYNGRY
jgi:uncharacterized protein YcfJ